MDLINKLHPITSETIPDSVDVLQELLNNSRHEAVRNEIGELGGIEKLTSYARDFISHSQTKEYFGSKEQTPFPLLTKTAIHLLRALRNLCVNSPSNQNLIRKSDICSNVASFLLLAESANPSSESRIAIRSGVQFFGNFVTSNSDNADYFWKLGFPNFFSKLLVSSDDALREHTLMLLYNCIRPFSSLREELVKSPFLKVLISTLVTLQESHEQMTSSRYFILLHVFSDDRFPEAYEALQCQDDLLKEQEMRLALLKVLDGMVEKLADELPRRAGRGEDDDLPSLEEQQVITSNCCSFFVRELGNLYNKDFSRVSRAAHASHEAEYASLKAQSAQEDSQENASDALKIAVVGGANAESQDAQERALREDAAQHTAKSAPAGSMITAKPVSVATALSSGEFELIYFMLRVIGHTTSLVEECDSSRLSKNGNDLRTNLGKEGLLALVVGTLRGTWELEQAAKARKEKEALFAPGYKRELMGIIANMTYNNKRNQDEVRDLGGVELVLNHCNLDDNNPFIREWALFAVRNLLEDNPENQNIVKGLKAEKVADTHGFLKDMGLGAELVNGVLKFKQKQPGKDNDENKN